METKTSDEHLFKILIEEGFRKGGIIFLDSIEWDDYGKFVHFPDN